MKQKNSAVIILLILLVIISAISVFSQQNQEGSIERWNIPYPKTFISDGFKNTLSFIHVEGNKFIDEKGNHIIFQGVNISDPDKLEKNGHWNICGLKM